ncbi:MAG: alpha-glucosidase C-terminal domain-containing protein [Fimbriimonadaceae bacterium]
MLLSASLGFLLLCRADPGGFSHTPGPVDTVRYNRDEFGVTLHVPADWTGRAVLVFVGPKEAARAADMTVESPRSYRARFRPTGEVRYAFWVNNTKYKPGAKGLYFDQAGLHMTSTPTWFDQVALQYREVKPPAWPGQGAVFYAVDTDRFGDGSNSESGAQSFTKHMDYVQALGVNGVWLNAFHSDSGDTVEDAHRNDWRVVAESTAAPKSVDGVAASNPPDFRGWRVALTDIDADALIQAGAANGVLDRRWDRLVYGFIRDPLVAPSAFASGLRNLRSDYPDAVADQMVLRLAGPGRPRPSAVFRADRNRLLQAFLLLLTLPGVPVIDAGDEIGLLDTDAPMEWNPTAQDSALLDTVKKLIQARTSRPSLYRGEYHTLDLGDDTHVFAFARIDRQETTLVLVSNSDQTQDVIVPVGQFGSAELRDLFGNTPFSMNGTTLSVSIPAHGFALIGS